MTQFNQLRFFATDIDGTLLGNEKALSTFKKLWKKHPPQNRPLLCYNTGRLLDDVLQLITDGILIQADYIISGVGTCIFNYHTQSIVKEFAEILEDGWDLTLVDSTINSLTYNLTKQPKHYQNDYKSSWYLNNATPAQIESIQESLDEANLDTLVIYSSARHLDVLPKWANKGNALRWLLKHLNIPTAETLVAGDSGNDNAMFILKNIHGIVVGNAQPELYQATKHLPIYHAAQHEICANAIINGLKYYGIFNNTDLKEEINPNETVENVLYQSLRLSDNALIQGLSQDELNFIRLGYNKAIEALKKNITPLGFSACSLEDNESTGTDENYRSVWARDGSITIIGSLPLLDKDEAIQACQRQTLLTLLSHISPNGQVPANVRIDDETPDYSGVGGIASIDSGLWLIIAFYAYVRKTRDLDLLRDHATTLQMIMGWLSAHDSNNDALLEIPEAGDWTDLFGRSYNVLYDEVLWYHCNICFGRLLQLLGDEQKAGDYLRWARVIKREIQTNFWPTTQQRLYQATSFAEQQYALGDARYLIAQVTPFDFNWRCDIFGNVLAFLYDVIDNKRAAQAFQFMWGVGVNEPFPVANLYPVVSGGDKDWRSYYTVNLLNLPHHYHNGGVWPFIGGAWVRFINKLGLRELALKELYRLTKLNKLGVLHEWEFNEWVHGRTGRPMGKAYQSWSASEFILACHTLNIIA